MAKDDDKATTEAAVSDDTKAKFREALERKKSNQHRTADGSTEHRSGARLGDRGSVAASLPAQVRLRLTPARPKGPDHDWSGPSVVLGSVRTAGAAARTRAASSSASTTAGSTGAPASVTT